MFGAVGTTENPDHCGIVIWNMLFSKCLRVSEGKRGAGARLTLGSCRWNQTKEWEKYFCLSDTHLPRLTLSTTSGDCFFLYSDRLFTSEGQCHHQTDGFVFRAVHGNSRFGVVVIHPSTNTCLTATNDETEATMEKCHNKNLNQLWQVCNSSGDMCMKTVAKYLSK